MFNKKKPSKYRDKYITNASGNSGSSSGERRRSSSSQQTEKTRRRPEQTSNKVATRTSTKPSSKKKTGKKKPKQNPIKRFFKNLTRLIIVLLVLVCVVAGYFFVQFKNMFNAINTTPMDESKLVTVNNDDNMKDYTNIALFGVDTRSLDLSEATRSDSIIVVTINNKTHDVKLTSIYRDTYCSINGEYSKITHAYAYGGPELAVSTINRNFDLNITQYATVNFKIMADIIDALGGLELTVESDFIDDLNKYIKETNKITGGDSDTIDEAGTYTLDGPQAVAYARIRHNQNGDYSRADRQRVVLKALATKMKAHPFKSMKALQDVIPSVQTNMTKSDLFRLALHVTQYNVDTNKGIPYKKDLVEGRVNGMCVEIPATLEQNAVRLHKDLFGTKDYQVSDELSKINQKIMNQSGYYD